MRIAHCGIGDQQLLLCENPLRKLCWSQFFELVSGPFGNRQVQIKLWQRSRRSINFCRGNDMCLSGIENRIGKKAQKFRCPIFTRSELEQLGSLVNKPSGKATLDEFRVRHDLDQERNIRLHTPDTEFLKNSFHAICRIDKSPSAHRHFDQQRIVKRIDHGTGKRASTIQPNPCPARRSVVRNPSIIGHEIVRRIFGCHATLNREAVRLDVRLRSEIDFGIRQRCPLCNKDLRFDNVDPGDFFCHGMFDLDTGIHFDEVEIIFGRIE